MGLRLGLHHPPGRLRREVIQARVRAIFKEHPEFTVQQFIANFGLEHPLGIRGSWGYVKAARMAGAKHSPAQKRVGWNIDRWTAKRIRIGEILRRHPEFKGKQVIKALGPDYSGPLRWVWQVMHEYRRGYPGRSRKGRRKGNRHQKRPRDVRGRFMIPAAVPSRGHRTSTSGAPRPR
jgi:hypothetical protein